MAMTPDEIAMFLGTDSSDNKSNNEVIVANNPEVYRPQIIKHAGQNFIVLAVAVIKSAGKGFVILDEPQQINLALEYSAKGLLTAGNCGIILLEKGDDLSQLLDEYIKKMRAEGKTMQVIFILTKTGLVKIDNNETASSDEAEEAEVIDDGVGEQPHADNWEWVQEQMRQAREDAERREEQRHREEEENEENISDTNPIPNIEVNIRMNNWQMFWSFIGNIIINITLAPVRIIRSVWSGFTGPTDPSCNDNNWFDRLTCWIRERRMFLSLIVIAIILFLISMWAACQSVPGELTELQAWGNRVMGDHNVPSREWGLFNGLTFVLCTIGYGLIGTYLLACSILKKDRKDKRKAKRQATVDATIAKKAARKKRQADKIAAKKSQADAKTAKAKAIKAKAKADEAKVKAEGNVIDNLKEKTRLQEELIEALQSKNKNNNNNNNKRRAS